MGVITVSQDDLATIVESYSEVTERLKRSHEMLGREGWRLREQLHQTNKELERRERLAALGEMALNFTRGKKKYAEHETF